MSKFLRPIHKLSKRLNFSLLDNNKEFKRTKRNKVNKHQKRLSSFGMQLNEKQKLRFRYFLSEKQLRNFFAKIRHIPGQKGENLLFNLECRLDNLIYRSGLATTRLSARQIVNHKNIMINNKVVNIPSYLVQINDIITLKKPKFRKLESTKNVFENPVKFEFLEFDKNNFAIKLLRLPNSKDIKQDIKLPLIIEYFNRYL